MHNAVEPAGYQFGSQTEIRVAEPMRATTQAPVPAEQTKESLSDEREAAEARRAGAFRTRNSVKRRNESVDYFTQLGNEANVLADVHGLPRWRARGDADHHRRNAIQHSYASATMSRNFGALPSTVAGNITECRNTADDTFTLPAVNWVKRQFGQEPKQGFPNQTADSWKDLWNNAVGREIGEYVRKHNLSQYDLEQLIMQAYWRGDLITQIDDGRIPKNASGWPRDFPGEGQSPKWQGPGADWRPTPGSGVAIIRMPRSWHARRDQD
jgi:hypothetical protein